MDIANGERPASGGSPLWPEQYCAFRLLEMQLAQSSVYGTFPIHVMIWGPALEAIREPRRCLQFLLLLAAFLLGGMYPALAADPTGYVTVVVANKGANTIYVAFTNYATQQPGQINWGNCASSVSNNQVSIASGGTCTASVPNNVGTSRFCASTTAM